ncbi:BlaI/MecI/CopY family transcriptional regulator [Rhodococcus chondri]|uniref:BlaI/MecI/CopY family transcriptional regulator n=1 Tax=Rhodococcus chondri TaxID=3065941 RepID=A0ABU7JQP3_9NOCA|nr:BlaI/MecI/CopY family transcriptional regulator [Rhodococcus sp. CC-R104]MEE2032346.1 BlaI/MecI/CopY family transcriptional regulator [Rhodococcus sp. CC-R104]
MGLGELESAVMDVLWQSDEPLRVRDVLARLEPERALAYTTVMTVLDNLHTKGMVSRSRVGRGYSYRAVRSREETAAELLRQVLRTSGDAEQVMLHFANSATEDESRILRRAARRTRIRSRGDIPS